MLSSISMTGDKDPAAVSLGSRGGKARAHNMSKAERKNAAILAATAPRKPSAPRCPCGKYTLHTAKLRSHKCE